jgi:hypothetical protein
VPATPAPPDAPDTDKPDTWQEKNPYPEDKLPLGRINLYAVDRLTLTLPSTLVDPRSPARPLPLVDARIRAMRAGTPEIKDQTWRHLAQLARAERDEWNLFALGMAYPGLRAKITPYVKGRGLSWHEAVDVHFTMAVEFLFALHRLDLARPWVFSRLLGAAYDHASGRKASPEPELVSLDRMRTQDREVIEDRERPEIQQPPGEPEQVLDRLVRQTREAPDGHRITARHAELIARTYLAGEKLTTVAASLGIGQSSASKQRARAAYLIALLLGRADLVTADAVT